MVKKSKNMNRGLQILFETYLKNDGKVSNEEFKIAKMEGYMFDYPKSLTHEESFCKLNELLKKYQKKKLQRLFCLVW